MIAMVPLLDGDLDSRATQADESQDLSILCPDEICRLLLSRNKSRI